VRARPSDMRMQEIRSSARNRISGGSKEMRRRTGQNPYPIGWLHVTYAGRARKIVKAASHGGGCANELGRTIRVESERRRGPRDSAAP
jgi:hypothetical protein